MNYHDKMFKKDKDILTLINAADIETIREYLWQALDFYPEFLTEEQEKDIFITDDGDAQSAMTGKLIEDMEDQEVYKVRAKIKVAYFK